MTGFFSQLKRVSEGIRERCHTSSEKSCFSLSHPPNTTDTNVSEFEEGVVLEVGVEVGVFAEAVRELEEVEVGVMGKSDEEDFLRKIGGVKMGEETAKSSRVGGGETLVSEERLCHSSPCEIC